jgi:hypothetical protein
MYRGRTTWRIELRALTRVSVTRAFRVPPDRGFQQVGMPSRRRSRYSLSEVPPRVSLEGRRLHSGCDALAPDRSMVLRAMHRGCSRYIMKVFVRSALCCGGKYELRLGRSCALDGSQHRLHYPSRSRCLLSASPQRICSSSTTQKIVRISELYARSADWILTPSRCQGASLCEPS